MLVAIVLAVFFMEAGYSIESLSLLLVILQTVIELDSYFKEDVKMSYRLMVGSGAHGAVQGLLGLSVIVTSAV